MNRHSLLGLACAAGLLLAPAAGGVVVATVTASASAAGTTEAHDRPPVDAGAGPSAARPAGAVAFHRP